MVISHPHFYTTHLEWAKTFNCQVWLAADDKQWRARLDDEGLRREITEEETVILDKSGEETGVVAVKLGGHFPGSCKSFFFFFSSFFFFHPPSRSLI